MQPKRAPLLGIVTRFFCAIALLSLALSAPAEANSRALSTEEVAAYMLPDGSLPSLCVTFPMAPARARSSSWGQTVSGFIIMT